MSLLSGLGARLRAGLERSREALRMALEAALPGGALVSPEQLAAVEEALIAADLGPAVAADFVARLREEAMYGRLEGPAALPGMLRELLEGALGDAATALDLAHRPAVLVLLGANGTGKTTTCAKLARLVARADKVPMLAAADTFRAAAIEQLAVWGERLGVEVVRQGAGADPGAVVFDALRAASSRGVDALIVDTAGRLPNKANLMAELAKLRRIVAQQMPGAPHETLLVLDAPTGQNGFAQARAFHDAVGLTGVVLTKLDGTSRGGIAVRIGRELGLPVKLLGVGEGVEDLQPFDRRAFVDALLPAW